MIIAVSIHKKNYVLQMAKRSFFYGYCFQRKLCITLR